MSISNQVISQYEEPVADICVDIEDRNIYGIDTSPIFFIIIFFGLVTILSLNLLQKGLEVSWNSVLYIMFQ